MSDDIDLATGLLLTACMCIVLVLVLFQFDRKDEDLF